MIKFQTIYMRLRYVILFEITEGVDVKGATSERYLLPNNIGQFLHFLEKYFSCEFLMLFGIHCATPYTDDDASANQVTLNHPRVLMLLKSATNFSLVESCTLYRLMHCIVQSKA